MTLPDAIVRHEGRAPDAFIAPMTSVVVMTIGAILPSLDGIAQDLRVDHANERQVVPMSVLIGLGLAQPVFGRRADAIIGAVIARACDGLVTPLVAGLSALGQMGAQRVTSGGAREEDA